MLVIKHLLPLLLIFGCGKEKEKTTNPNSPLQAKMNLYLSLTPSQTDKYGFPLEDSCDGLLWASLYGAAGGNVNIKAAQITPGEWMRNPSGLCFSISRDMMLGLLLYIWDKRDLQMIEDLIDYGETHSFNMSKQMESDFANIMSPDIISTMYLLRDKLGGSKNVVAEAFDQSSWIPGQVGFLAHLQVMHLLIRGLANGSINEFELGLLKNYADLSPDNALYNAVYHRFKDGDQSKAIASLMNINLFPASSLPTNNNYCTNYLFQRDEYNALGQLTDDWKLCSDIATHSGVDFEIASALVLGILK